MTRMLTQGERKTLRTSNVGRYVVLGDGSRVIVTDVSFVEWCKVCRRCAFYVEKTAGDDQCPYIDCCTRPFRPDRTSVIFELDKENRYNRNTNKIKK